MHLFYITSSPYILQNFFELRKIVYRRQTDTLPAEETDDDGSMKADDFLCSIDRQTIWEKIRKIL